jgi:hypothetical protein
VEEAAAAQRIRQFLSNQRANEAVAMEMKRLKQQAKIEYVGEFAEGAAVTEAKRKAQSEAAKNGAIPPMKMPQQIIDNGNGGQK